MSRITRALVLLILIDPAIAAAEQPNLAKHLATYWTATSVEPHCNQAAGNEIMVCGRRAADRYRVPFIVYEKGDPRAEGFWGERERIQHQTTPCQNLSIFLVGCGAVGVSAKVGFGAGGLTTPRLRPLAP